MYTKWEKELLSCVIEVKAKLGHLLGLQDRRIRGLLEGCSLEHEARLDALRGRFQERAQSDARWKQFQRESNKAVCRLCFLACFRLGAVIHWKYSISHSFF